MLNVCLCMGFHMCIILLSLVRLDKLGICILSNSCMGVGLVTVITSELSDSGVQWATLTTPASPSDNFHLGYVYLMLAVDTILYMILAWSALCTLLTLSLSPFTIPC